MLGWLNKRRNRWKEGLLTEEQAKAIIEEEIRKRDWERYHLRRYTLEREKGRALWKCHGLTGSIHGGTMGVHIDARTGEVVTAAARSFGDGRGTTAGVR